MTVTHRRIPFDAAETPAPADAMQRVEDDEEDGERDGHEDEHHEVFGWMEAARLSVVAICALATLLRWPDAFPPILRIGEQVFLPFSWYAFVGLVFGGWPIFKAALEDIRERKMTMELSMTIAILAGAYTGYFLAVLVIIFFVLFAEILEEMTVERGRRAIRELLAKLPRQVTVRRAGGTAEIATEDLKRGDAVLVAPGGLVPVDGEVIGGHSFIDESQISGESLPLEKLPGAKVYAGSINQSGAIEIRTERIGRDTSYGKIIEAVEKAERSKAPIQRLSDQLAGYIVIMALLFAAYTYYVTHDVQTTISIIIVAGACEIAAGTPLAILGAIGRAARLGAIVKGGRHMEMLGKINTVVLDKTGTLTFGRPEVERLAPAAGVTEEALLAAAATAELRSEHALGHAIIAHAERRGLDIAEPGSFSYTPGRGIEATAGDATVLVGNEAFLREGGVEVPFDPRRGAGGASVVLVARDRRFLGSIAIADTVRPEAARAIERMKAMRLRVILLTGDSPAVANAVAGRLGIDEVEAELLPEHKVERVKALVAGRRKIAMVGDGINDAPALAAAHVGVAMGSGTDVARESADVVLLGNDLERFVDTVAVARRARRIIWFNVIGTITIDVLGMTAAYYMLVGPIGASIIHTVSELAFILNSARLLPRWLPFRRPKPQAPEGHSGVGVEQQPVSALPQSA